MDGFYRFIEQPAHSQVRVKNILAPHRERTVLCVQGGSDLNFATRPGCEGLELIGRNQTSAKTLGLRLHAALAVNGNGLPLGVVRCGFDALTEGAKAPRKGIATKMRRWTDGYRDIAELTRELGAKTGVICVRPRGRLLRAVRCATASRTGRAAGACQT